MPKAAAMTLTTAASVPKSATAVDRPLFADDIEGLDAGLRKAASQHGFTAKVAQTMPLVDPKTGSTEILVGLGKASDLTEERLRKAAAAFGRAVFNQSAVASTMVSVASQRAVDDDSVELNEDQVLAAVVEGLRLSTYRYRDFKSDYTRAKGAPKIEKMTIVAKGRGLRSRLSTVEKVVDAVLLARDMVNEPGGSMTPQKFVEQARQVAGQDATLKCTVWSEARIKKERMGGILAVNQGSEHPPQFVTLSYRPTRRSKAKAPHVALVGKGVTFDSGGLSLKTAQGMMTMKIDMAGAAAVLATMSALPAVDAPIDVTAYIPLTDNMTGPNAQRPGDVFVARNGKTVEVLNTDAEGRLILADALSVASESSVDAIIDIATLTGSATAALGTGYAALMATDDDVASRLEQASARTGEKVWRLPLPTEYRTELDSAVADLRNVGSKPYGGALIAGLFLKEFVDGKPWAHIDVGLSVYSDTTKGLVTKGATGFGVRLLVDTLRNWS